MNLFRFSDLTRRISLVVAAIATSVLGLSRCSQPQPELSPTTTAPGASAPSSAGSTSTSTSAGIAESQAVETDILAGVARVRPATVCLVFEDQESNRRGTGSGVIVAVDEERALVLTCGHVTRSAGRACSVVLPDGRLFSGESTAAIQQDGCDLGLVAFHTGGEEIPFAALATGSPSIGDWGVVLGHPRGLWIADAEDENSDGPMRDESEPGSSSDDAGDLLVAPRWRTDSGAPGRDRDRASLSQSVRPAVVRAGRIWSEPGPGLGLSFDAPIEAGDSGGPVIDRSGRVVGIASRCGWKSYWNWASSTEILAGDPTRLLDDALVIPPGDGDPGAGAGNARLPDLGRDAFDRLTSHQSAAQHVRESVAAVESEGGTRAFAVAAAPGGYFVTKGSEVSFSAPLALSREGMRVPAERIAYDPDADLLLLRARSLDVHLPTRRAPRDPSPGALLLNVGASGEILSKGVMSLESAQLEEPEGRPFLGVSWRAERDGAARVGAVVAGTAAARAGLRVGDRILTADGQPFSDRRSLAEWIGTRQVGDKLLLGIERDGAPGDVEVRLDRRHPSIRGRDRGNTRVSISRVLPYRTRIWQQDGVIDPDQCGSAVVDLEGRFVGLNIGRADRTATIVIPADELDRRVSAMLARAARDPQRFDELASASFGVTEDSGRLRLATVDARFVGPRRLARLIGNALTPNGSGTTIMADDRLLWDAIVDAPGRFEVVFAGSVRGTRSIRLEIGETQVEAEVPEGRHRRGTILGEVDIRSTGRVPVALEWAGGEGGEVPGSISYIELRRISTSEPVARGESRAMRASRAGNGSRSGSQRGRSPGNRPFAAETPFASR